MKLSAAAALVAVAGLVQAATAFGPAQTIPVPAEGEGFGAAVALKDDYLVVGAPLANGGAGAVYLYEFTESATWASGGTYELKDIIHGSTSSGMFGMGSSVAIDSYGHIYAGTKFTLNEAPQAYQLPFLWNFERHSDGSYAPGSPLLNAAGLALAFQAEGATTDYTLRASIDKLEVNVAGLVILFRIKDLVNVPWGPDGVVYRAGLRRVEPGAPVTLPQSVDDMYLFVGGATDVAVTEELLAWGKTAIEYFKYRQNSSQISWPGFASFPQVAMYDMEIHEMDSSVFSAHFDNLQGDDIFRQAGARIIYGDPTNSTGTSVAICNNRVYVGAPAFAGTGAVHVFTQMSLDAFGGFPDDRAKTDALYRGTIYPTGGEFGFSSTLQCNGKVLAVGSIGTTTFYDVQASFLGEKITADSTYAEVDSSCVTLAAPSVTQASMTSATYAMARPDSGAVELFDVVIGTSSDLIDCSEAGLRVTAGRLVKNPFRVADRDECVALCNDSRSCNYFMYKSGARNKCWMFSEVTEVKEGNNEAFSAGPSTC